MLYTLNVFNFQRVSVTNIWKEHLPSFQWDAIRHMHISTMFQEIGGWRRPELREGESKENWIECCKHLRELPNLQSLRIELTIWLGVYKWEMKHGPCDVEDDFIVGVLEPLRDIKVAIFEVELNIPARPGDGDMMEVFSALGEVDFTCYKKQRDVKYLVLRAMMAA
jgi:hypothetical protein